MRTNGNIRRQRLPRPALLRAGAAVTTVTLLCAFGAAGATHGSTGPATVASAAAAQRTIAASNGVALAAHPDRIVSLSDASTEDLFAIGAGHQVVAVDQYSTYPPNAPRTKLSGFSPNVEAIARYKPDLVVISDNVDHIESQLASLHVPVLLEAAPADLAGADAQITQLGAVTGHAPAAAAVVAGMRTQVAEIVASVKREHPPLTVYHELDQTYYTATSHTFVGQIYQLLGLRNIADEAQRAGAYVQLSSEYIVAANPDLIVLADTVCCGQSYRTVAARPAWSRITAVREHHVLVVNDTIASEWGPRIVIFLRQVADAVRKIEAPQ
jgi:iron complex transport system substrate-binding protein